MNSKNATARRYHWYSEKIEDLVCEPHSGIATQIKGGPTLNLTAKASAKTRDVSTELASAGYERLKRDFEILRKHSGEFSRMISLKEGEER